MNRLLLAHLLIGNQSQILLLPVLSSGLGPSIIFTFQYHLHLWPLDLVFMTDGPGRVCTVQWVAFLLQHSMPLSTVAWAQWACVLGKAHVCIHCSAAVLRVQHSLLGSTYCPSFLFFARSLSLEIQSSMADKSMGVCTFTSNVRIGHISTMFSISLWLLF